MTAPNITSPENNSNTANAIGLNLVQAINNLNQTLKAVFPQANGTASTAGAASGLYLPVTINGTTYKIQLLADS